MRKLLKAVVVLLVIGVCVNGLWADNGTRVAQLIRTPKVLKPKPDADKEKPEGDAETEQPEPGAGIKAPAMRIKPTKPTGRVTPDVRLIPGAVVAAGRATCDLMVELSGPNKAIPGQRVGLKIRVSNKGPGTAPGTLGAAKGNGYMVDLVLSEDTDYPVEWAVQPVYHGKTSEDFVEDMLLLGGRISRTNDVAARSSTGYTLEVPIPKNTPPGVYCIGAVVDPGQSVPEVVETNNRYCLAIQIGAREEPGAIPPRGVETWVMPYGVGGTPLNEIKPNGYTDTVGKAAGVTIVDAPFGSRLGMRHGYSDDIPSRSIMYYRWLYKHTSEREYTEMIEPVNVHYVLQHGTVTKFPVYNLGPKAVGGKSLYEFRPDSPPPATDPGARTYWPTTDWFGDIYSGFLTSQALSPGQYQIKLEVYNSAGNLVMPGPTTFRFIVPTNVLADGTIETAPATSLHAGGVVFNLQIDNRHCSAAIDAPTIGGTAASDQCGFLKYAAKGQNVRIGFHATHPANHAVFRFRIVRAIAEVTRVAADVTAAPVSGYAGDGAGNYERNFTVSTLLGPCPQRAAFSENLYVYAKATNGWHRLHRLDASYVRAFALAPELLY